MQCKDIPDLPVLRFLRDLPPWEGQDTPRWGTWYWTEPGEDPDRPDYQYKPINSVQNAMPPGVPDKLRQAKMRRLMARGLVDGCPCGCRGDYQLTDEGRAWLAANDPDATPAPKIARTKAFEDDYGNRFIFPGLVESESMSFTDIMLRALELDIILRLKSEWFEFDPDNFPHLRIVATSPAFRHGGENVLLFAGPEFDKVKEELPTNG